MKHVLLAGAVSAGLIFTMTTAAIATADKPEVTSSVGVTSNAVEPAKPAQSTAALACKEYSAALGDMITVPCS